MYNFRNDYSYGAHPKVLAAMTATNMECNPGYGEDAHCARAIDLIRKACAAPQAEVQFLIGGTQVNFLAICALLRPWEAVICAATAHINGHEGGAVEATGHKLLNVEVGTDGKLTPAHIHPVMEYHTDPHLTLPALVYISNATENGVPYTLAELQALSQTCRQYGLLLFVDGARMGYALAAKGGDVTLAHLAEYTDAFTIGGTKNGAMMGEALVITKPELGQHFFRVKKQRGGVLAKGWLLGAQFETLFTDDLYFEIARHADGLAAKLQSGMQTLGLRLFVESVTNQVFVLIPDPLLGALDGICYCESWGRFDETHTIIRFVTSFGTTEDDVSGLLEGLSAILRA